MCVRGRHARQTDSFVFKIAAFSLSGDERVQESARGKDARGASQRGSTTKMLLAQPFQSHRPECRYG